MALLYIIANASGICLANVRLSMLLDLPKQAPVVSDPTSSTHKLVLLGITDKGAVSLALDYLLLLSVELK